MSRAIRLGSWFEEDVSRQTRWYLSHAGAAVALAFGDKLDSTLQRLAESPETGIERNYAHPELTNVRCIPVDGPFDRFLVFYRVTADEVRVARLMRGMRDLPRRLLDPPGAD